MQGRSRLSDRHSMKTTGLIGSDFDSEGRRGPSATDERVGSDMGQYSEGGDLQSSTSLWHLRTQSVYNNICIR